MVNSTVNSPFDILPQTIITSSVLPFISSDDWLQFRAASRSSYETVHGTLDVSHSYCTVCQSSTDHRSEVAASSASEIHNHISPNEEVENLWKLALIREYRFELGSDNIKQSIHSPASERECFLSTRDVFTTSTAFISWKHWRKLEARCGDVETVSGDGSEIPVRQSRISNPNRQVVGPFFLRAAAMWKKIEAWFDASGDLGHLIKRTMFPGKDLTSITHLHFRDDDVLSALVSVYSFYSGQGDTTRYQECTGLFGGYSAYDFKCMMSWVPWLGLHNYNSTFGYVYPIASDLSECTNVYLDLKTGQMLIGNIQTDEITLAVPENKQYNSSIHCNSFYEDDLLRWFEEYAKRLSTGYYTIGKLSSESEVLSILRYPAMAVTNRCSRAVTRGIEIVASSTFHPFSNLSGEPLHVYSIRIRLLTPDEDGYVPQEQRGFKTCQLHLRHWIITKQIGSEEFEEEVRGEGVIGEYPLLVEGGYQNYSGRNASVIAHLPTDSFERKEIETGTFSYQSCMDLESKIFQGYLTFVPGSLYNPAGEPFQVRVAPFHLCSNPDYLY